MKQESLDVQHPPGARLRTLIASMERHVAQLSADAPSVENVASLKQAWDALFQALAMDFAPLLRACPNCGRHISSAAPRCGYCMAESQGAVVTAGADESAT